MRRPVGNGVRVVVASDEYRAVAAVVEAMKRTPPGPGCVGLEAVLFPHNTDELARAIKQLYNKLGRARWSVLGTRGNLGV